MASFEGVYWALPEGIPHSSRERLAYLALEMFPPKTASLDCAAWCLWHPHAHDAAIRLLREVHRRGAELAVQGGTSNGTVLVRDPGKRVSVNLRQQIHDITPDMIVLLRFGPAWELTLAEFDRSATVCRVPLAGREVLVAASSVDPCHSALAEANEQDVFRVQTLPAEGRAYFARLGGSLQ